MICPKCGRPTTSKSHRCPFCGAPIGPSDEPLSHAQKEALSFLSPSLRSFRGAELEAMRDYLEKAREKVASSSDLAKLKEEALSTTRGILTNGLLKIDLSDYAEGEQKRIRSYLDEFQKGLQSASGFDELNKCAFQLYYTNKMLEDLPTAKQVQVELDQNIDEIYEKATHGDVGSMYALALLYKDGKGVTASHQDAFLWFEKAAKKGHPLAMEELGDCYYNGAGTSRDYALAEKWYKKAAKKQGL